MASRGAKPKALDRKFVETAGSVESATGRIAVDFERALPQPDPALPPPSMPTVLPSHGPALARSDSAIRDACDRRKTVTELSYAEIGVN